MGKRFYKPPRMVDYRILIGVDIYFRRFFIFMNPKIALEVFGYFGTALVLLSFVMKDIKWLRAINMAGGFISLIYAICVNTMPVVVLNASLITINGIQLIRILREERKKRAVVNKNEDIAYDKEDIEYDKEKSKKEENI